MKLSGNPLSSCHHIKICTSHLFTFVYMLFALLVSIMCLHPVIDRKLSTMYDKYQNDSLDNFGNCDYMYSVSDVMRTDLVVMQINIRGIASKRSQLIDLINNSVHNKQVNVVLLSETCLTEFSPAFDIPRYSIHRQDSLHKKGGGVAILISSNLRGVIRHDLSSK